MHLLTYLLTYVFSNAFDRPSKVQNQKAFEAGALRPDPTAVA